MSCEEEKLTEAVFDNEDLLKYRHFYIVTSVKPEQALKKKKSGDLSENSLNIVSYVVKCRKCSKIYHSSIDSTFNILRHLKVTIFKSQVLFFYIS